MDTSSTTEGVTKSHQELKHLLTLSYLQCSHRGLLYSASWAIELANSLDATLEAVPQLTFSPLYQSELVQYSYGKSLYDLREFRRASHSLKECCSVEAVFLRLYCLYLAGEKIKSDEDVETIGETSTSKNPFLQQIKQELAEKDQQNLLDGFGYYLYGIIEREIGMKSSARELLVRACHSNPLIWSAWEELCKLCDDRNMLINLSVPDHWMKDFFIAAGFLELIQTNDALACYSHLSAAGFNASSYINQQLALAHYQLKDFPQSADIFQHLRLSDPYNLNGIDVYSHVLFVMEMLPELYQLAIDVDSLDKYRAESCSVIGNFYSLHGDHEKSCCYFKRAVQLDKTNHTSWILLGHEYLELKNHSQAIDAYIKALETNKHDFRSYYGLGHTYELLKMHYFALTYYKMAHSLQPSDGRVLYALGYCYDTLEEIDSAKKCYKRAIALQNPEGSAIIKLSKLHIRLQEDEEASKLLLKYLALAETGKITSTVEEEGGAHLHLARYHLRKGQYTEGEAHAHKCTEFIEVREEGKSVLQEIYKRREMLQGPSHFDIDISPIQ